MAHSARLLATFGLLLLAACAPTRDPSQAGLFSGIANLVGGAYETDTALLRAEAEASETRVAALRAENERLTSEAAELDSEERALRERQSSLNRRLIKDEHNLQALRSQRGADQTELDRLTAKLAELEAEHQQLSAGKIDPAELEKLEQENSELEKYLDQLLGNLPGSAGSGVAPLQLSVPGGVR